MEHVQLVMNVSRKESGVSGLDEAAVPCGTGEEWTWRETAAEGVSSKPGEEAGAACWKRRWVGIAGALQEESALDRDCTAYKARLAWHQLHNEADPGGSMHWRKGSYGCCCSI
jgi:hypothetical protein